MLALLRLVQQADVAPTMPCPTVRNHVLFSSQAARMELLDALGSNTALAAALATYQVHLRPQDIRTASQRSALHGCCIPTLAWASFARADGGRLRACLHVRTVGCHDRPAPSQPFLCIRRWLATGAAC